MNNISKYIKDIRMNEGLSMAEFARKNDIPIRSYLRIEKGDIRSLININKILKNYGLDLIVSKKFNND